MNRATGRVVAGVVLGALALWLAFRGFQVEELFDSLGKLSLPLTAAALLSTLVTLLVVSWRWQWLFHPRQGAVSFSSLFKGIVVGQMVNILSPIRVGELARVFVVAEEQHLSKTYVLATVALEKVLDLVVFASSIALLLALVALPDGVRIKTSAQLGVALAALLALVAATRFGIPAARFAERQMPALPARWRQVASATLHRFIDGLAVLQRPHVGGILLGQSVLVIFCSALTNYLLIEAFGLDVPVWGALFLLVLLQVGSVPPSLPGRLGVFNYLVVVGLGVFGVAKADALSYSLVLYAVALLPKVALGIAYVGFGAGHLSFLAALSPSRLGKNTTAATNDRSGE